MAMPIIFFFAMMLHMGSMVFPLLTMGNDIINYNFELF